VWFPLATPKHAFHAFFTWQKLFCLLVQNFFNWGFQGNVQWSFSSNGIEDREYLFFLGGFSKRIWGYVMKKYNMANPNLTWDEVIAEGIQNWQKKTLSWWQENLGLGFYASINLSFVEEYKWNLSWWSSEDWRSTVAEN